MSIFSLLHLLQSLLLTNVFSPNFCEQSSSQSSEDLGVYYADCSSSQCNVLVGSLLHVSRDHKRSSAWADLDSCPAWLVVEPTSNTSDISHCLCVWYYCFSSYENISGMISSAVSLASTSLCTTLSANQLCCCMLCAVSEALAAQCWERWEELQSPSIGDDPWISSEEINKVLMRTITSLESFASPPWG